MSFSFGNTSVAQPAAPATSSGFSFGAAPAAAAPASSGFSFGAAPAAPASSGFSFGATPAAPAAAPPASSGFSFGAATTPAPTTGGGFSFGSSTGGAPAASSGFSFGGTAAAPSTAARSLFGSTPTAASTTAAGSSLFGGASTGTSSLFGAAPAAGGSTSFFGAAPAAGGSVFGAPAPAPASSFGLFGGAAAAPQPNGQGITLETPFEALPADVQKNIVEFHKCLKDADQSDAFVKTVSPRQLDALRTNIARLEQDVLAHRNGQDRQATAVHHVRKDVKHLIHQVDAATLSMRTLDGHAASSVYSILRHVETPSPYYWDLLAHYERQMAAIKGQIEALESEYRPLVEACSTGSAQLAASGATVSPARLHQILVAQNASLMHVAARVAEVHERADELRQRFLEAMRADLARHGEHSPAAFTNPFDRRKKAAAHDDKRETIDKIRFRTSVAPTIVAPAAAAAPAPAPQLGLATTGFGGFGAAAATPATTSLFGSTATTAVSTAPTTTTTSLFGSTPAAASTSTGGFSFGAAAPKSVSFNLGGSTAPAAAAPSASSTVPAFTVPSVATTGSAFGSVASSFLPPPGDAEKRAASSKRLNGRPKKRT